MQLKIGDIISVIIKVTLSKELNGIMKSKVLNKEKIQEIRAKAQNGEEADVHDEIENQEENKAQEE